MMATYEGLNIEHAKTRSKELIEIIKLKGYDCECKAGGVDAMSVDTDWLEVVAELFAWTLEQLEGEK